MLRFCCSQSRTGSDIRTGFSSGYQNLLDFWTSVPGAFGANLTGGNCRVRKTFPPLPPPADLWADLLVLLKRGILDGSEPEPLFDESSVA